MIYQSYDEMDPLTREVFETIDFWYTEYNTIHTETDTNADFVEEPTVEEEEPVYIADGARNAIAKIVFNGTDITKDISPYLLSLTYTDNEEDESDDLQIKIQDREGVWLTKWLPEAISPASSATTQNSQSSTDTVEPVTVVTAETTSSSTYTVNSKTGMNLRDTHSITSEIIVTLPYGTEVTVTDRIGRWSQVEYNGTTGYMMSAFLSPAGVATSQQSATTSNAAAGSVSSESTDVSSYPTLRFGSQGEYVKTMQNALIAKGQSLPKYGVDGYFGSETQAAVKAFQTSAGIAVDGICGPITWNALLGTATGSEASKGFSIAATIIRNNWHSNSAEQLDCGQFELDSLDASGPPSIITIKGTALPYSSQIRQTKKSKAWEKITLSGIANEMASENGMACMYESSYDPTYSHIEQSDESDITFLQRLAHGAGISLKATNNILVLFDQQSYEKLDSVMSIGKDDGSYLKYKLSTGEAQTQYASCRVSYTLPNGTLIEGVAKVADYNAEAKNNQQLEIREKVDSIGEATILAQKYLRLRNKFTKTVSLTFEGNPVLLAGVCINMSGFGYWDGKYIVTQAKHSIGSSGYTTAVSMRNVLEGY